ncbi:midas domain-containing protein [Staphylococcus saprophyticus]|jgi:FtsZ-interacting cell division protein ZipA|uniref:hypothetical protein n=1 Tax=Staphylococcus saprophyticus TaxID=29385 RepID=UPI001642DBA6|nr:hypothetical protein [Staphylococcus saprophyticus]MBC2921546.1 hypothetical protein [Staphylococcus saprophyticus]MBC2957743.1 hypothetical protein [Staphylococcus saprophyticus]MBC3009840.1 hypothetical protein [Staphylococcus saprophyticus]MBC3023865.1 hypothetical protein [Staphylococcus saprophyticus]MBC3030872.1 hypothetical protein [Staphylococcus saprophyticus]
MKKILFLLLASFLVLTACGNKEESKSEDKKETKSSSEESKKDDKKSDNSKKDNKKLDEEKSKTDDKSSEQVADNENVNTEEQPSTQESVQSQEQPNQTQQQQAPVQHEPTDQEKMEANAKVAKENGYTGIPNGDVGLLNPNKSTPNEPEAQESDWVKGQDEWMNASESEKEEIRKADAEKYGYEYDPSDYE